MFVQHTHCSGECWWWQQTLITAHFRMISALQDQGMLSQAQPLLLPGNFLRKRGSVASWLGLAGPPWNSGAVGHGWPGDICPGTSITGWPLAEWNLPFWNFCWIDKRSNELPALEDLGVCCVYFFLCIFCPIWAGTNSKNSHFPTDWESSFSGKLQLFWSLCPTFLSWTVVFIWEWKN